MHTILVADHCGSGRIGWVFSSSSPLEVIPARRQVLQDVLATVVLANHSGV
jgi:hypothetical protein